MSETSDMWDRFFRGSKYEWKWLKRGKLASVIPASEAVGDWQRRLADARSTEGASAPPANPFGEASPAPKTRASGDRR